MVDLQSTFNDYTGTPAGAFKPIGTLKSRRLKSVNKFRVSIENSSRIFAAAKLCIGFQTSSKGWAVQAF